MQETPVNERTQTAHVFGKYAFNKQETDIRTLTVDDAYFSRRFCVNNSLFVLSLLVRVRPTKTSCMVVSRLDQKRSVLTLCVF